MFVLKNRIFIFIAAVFILSLFCGCASNDDAADAYAPKTISLSDVLSEAFSTEGAYADELGNGYNYSYHVPMLLIDSPDARRINKEMETLLMDCIDQEMENMDMQCSLTVPQCGYSAYLNGDALSIVLFIHSDFEYSEYACYNIDVRTGKELSNEELLSLSGHKYEDFLAIQKAALKRGFESLYGSDDGGSLYNDMLSLTLSEDNITLDCPVYLGSDCELRLIGKIYSFAGADYYFYPLSAGNESEPFVTEIQTRIN